MTADLVFSLNDVDDYIAKNSITERYENNDEYRFKGVEIVVSKIFLKTGMVGLGYSYLDAKDQSPGSQVDENYEESYGFPQAGRTAYLGMKVKF